MDSCEKKEEMDSWIVVVDGYPNLPPRSDSLPECEMDLKKMTESKGLSSYENTIPVATSERSGQTAVFNALRWSLRALNTEPYILACRRWILTIKNLSPSWWLAGIWWLPVYIPLLIVYNDPSFRTGPVPKMLVGIITFFSWHEGVAQILVQAIWSQRQPNEIQEAKSLEFWTRLTAFGYVMSVVVGFGFGLQMVN